MRNILYLHGFGGSSTGKTATSFRKNLDSKNYTFHALDWNESKPIEELSRIKQYIKDNNIDLVIGSSLGGFLTLNLHSVCRFVINPCYKPSIELPKLHDNIDVSEYSILEQELSKYVDGEDRELCIGFFGTKDELFSYKNEFMQDGFVRVVDINSGHRPSEKVIKDDIITYIDCYFTILKSIQKNF